MQTSTTATVSVRGRMVSRSSLVESMQEITLRAELNRAIHLVAECFDNCNRQAEPGSPFSEQADACAKQYALVDGHKTTLTYTKNLIKNLIHSGLDYLKSATDAAMNTGSAGRWPSLPLTRALIEASADCLWLVDPALNLETRLRRTNQMFVRSCHEILRLLPDPRETTPRFISISPVARERETVLEARDAAVKWAQEQGWKCGDNKTITCRCWIREIPSKTDLVALATKEHSINGKDLYSFLSGASHSQHGLMALSLSVEPNSLLDQALTLLDIGIFLYTDALRQFAENMGWQDHDVDKWFAPVHQALQHIRDPENTPLPRVELEERCEVCPD